MGCHRLSTIDSQIPCTNFLLSKTWCREYAYIYLFRLSQLTQNDFQPMYVYTSSVPVAVTGYSITWQNPYIMRA